MEQDPKKNTTPSAEPAGDTAPAEPAASTTPAEPTNTAPMPTTPPPAQPYAAPTAIPSTPKSATAAGLLGIFLGGFGAHNWYLGQKREGIIHVSLVGGGFLLVIISAILVSATIFRAPALSAMFSFLTGLGYIVISGNSIWGFVEGIILLSHGDAGLAAKGYTVAAPVVYAQPNQPTQPVQPAQPTQPTPPTQPQQ